MPEMCATCGLRARDGEHRQCKRCQRKGRTETLPTETGIRPVGLRHPTETVSAAPGTFIPDPDGLTHCDRCSHPAGYFEPPVHPLTGHRILGQDPRGWAPGHGLGSGKLCCQHYVCYDVRPGHRVWAA